MKCICENWMRQKDGRWKVTVEGDGIDILEVRYEDECPAPVSLGCVFAVSYIPEHEYYHRLDVYNRRKSMRLVVDNEKKS